MLSIFSAVMEIDYLFLGLANLLTIISREQELCRCEMQECLGGEGMLRITKWDSVTGTVRNTWRRKRRQLVNPGSSGI